MGSNALGGGILFIVIALLWVAVLAPSFARGREFRAAEQNAARLQRTLRLLAETAAVPEEHHVEAKAKEALAYEKKLRVTQKHLDQVRKKELQQLRMEQRTEELRKQKELGRQQAILRQERLRSAKFKPVRLTAAFTVLAGIAGSLVGLGLAIAGLGWLVFFLAAAATGVGFSALILLAPGAAKKVHAKVEPVHKFLPAEAPTVQAVAKESVTEPVSDEEIKRQEHIKAQAKAAAERERARVMAQLRAKAREEAKACALAKENVTDSIMLKKDKPTKTVKDQGSQKETQAPKAEATPATATKKSGLSARLERMGVVEESTPTVNVTDMLSRRRNAS